MNDERCFTLAEAAKLIGVSVPTARRLVLSGTLKAHKVLVNDRMRWEVSQAEVFRVKSEASFTKRSSDSELSKVEFTESSKLASDDMNVASGVPLSAHLAAIDLAGKQLELFRLQVAEERSRAEQERRRAEQAERAASAMRFQLQQYQTTIAEQAESLVEERALRRVAETQATAALTISELETKATSQPPLKKRRNFWSWLRGGRSSFSSTDVG